MTATGIALIAGGLATLISFRRVLWSGQGRRRGPARTKRRTARTRAIEGARQLELSRTGASAAVLPAQAGAPDISGAHVASTASAEVRPSRRSQRRGRSGVPGSARADVERDEDERAGLASIGLADEEPTGSDEDEPQQYDERPEAEESYRDSGRSDVSDQPTGDYWMPVPDSAYTDLDSADDELPRRGDRDPAAESEHTAVVPLWPPARPSDRIGMPRTWSEGPRLNRRTLRETAGRREHQADEQVVGEHWDQIDRNGHDGWTRNSTSEGERRRRPRPRPNPAAEARSTVYVSRHAAEVD